MSDKVLAYTLLRLFMGLNMFMHGAVRLGENYGAFIEWTQGVFAETWLPSFLVTIEAALIPPVEMTVGVLLFLGFKTRFALMLAVGLMATLVFGMNVVQDWELVFRHVVYVCVFSGLMFNREYNEFSLDGRKSA
ncbi:MAG: DoxX family membrane protein [Gammaproteobacteria bacterium]|jgi:thiosulfate dehydrogenase (quinone) large subunit|nr:DoxX family membrane protein [Gammaproteobacteria bacterium]